MIKFFRGFAFFILISLLVLLIFTALIMPEQLDRHFSQVIAFVAALTGLVSVIWTQYNKKIEEDNKRIQAEEDKKYQISKETYQKLFEQKIKLYEKLYTQINKFKKQLYDVGKYFNTVDSYGRQDMEKLTVEDVSVSALQEIFNSIQENHFVVSNELMDSYLKLYDLYRNHTAEFDFMYDVGAYGHPDEIKSEWGKIRNKFYEKYKNTIDEFFNQIEQDTREMKKVLEY